MIKMKVLLSFLFVFFAFAVYPLYSQDMKPETRKFLSEGDSLMKAENYQGAIASYDNALAIEKDFRIYFQKSLAQKKAQDLQGAKVSLDECIKLKNDFDAAYNALGIVDFSLGNFEDARINFEKFLTLSTKEETNKSVKKNLAITYYKLSGEQVSAGDTTKAIEYLNKSVEYDNYDASYLSLAKLHAEHHEWDKSITAAENALKYKNKITEGGPYFYMGVSYKGKGDIVKAKEMFEKAKADTNYKKPSEYALEQLNKQ